MWCVMLDDKYSLNYYSNQIHEIKKWSLNLGGIYIVIFTVIDAFRYSGASAQSAILARTLYMIIPFIILITAFYHQKRLNISNKMFDALSLVSIILIGIGHGEIIKIAANHTLFFPRIGLTIILIYSGLLLALPIKLSIISSAAIILSAAYAYVLTGMNTTEISSLVLFYIIFSSCCVFMNHYFLKILNANYKLMAVIDEQANSDELTHLYNRRYFYNQSENVAKHAAREKKSMALMLVDLDNFKSINDQLGHQYGDSVLIKIANALQPHSRRPLDITARLGGDEFVILMYDTDIEHINSVCNNIIADISCISTGINQQNQSLNLGISIGVAFNHTSDNYSIKDMMGLADKALYHVKHKGKNDFHINKNNTTQNEGANELLKTV